MTERVNYKSTCERILLRFLISSRGQQAKISDIIETFGLMFNALSLAPHETETCEYLLLLFICIIYFKQFL